MPDRLEAARLLRSLHPPDWFLRHSRAVAEIAAWLARRAATAGRCVDRTLVEAAALLHDVDKLLPREHPVIRLGHGAAGAAWLAERGHPELGPAVACHPVTRLADDAWWEAWRATASLEERFVAYADKRAGQHREAMGERFADWERRYPPADDARGAFWSAEMMARVRRRADELERHVCEATQTRPENVRRLRWTDAALAAAEARAA